jgi:hypothetical protein
MVKLARAVALSVPEAAQSSVGNCVSFFRFPLVLSP